MKNNHKRLLETKFTYRLAHMLLDYLCLSTIKKSPIHAYALLQRLKRKYGAYFSPSTLYPTLEAMEQQGFIKSVWQEHNHKARRVYSLTVTGLNALVSQNQHVRQLMQNLGELNIGKETAIDKWVACAMRKNHSNLIM